MGKLILEPNLSRHDDIYQALVALTKDLSDQQSLQALSTLSLILINHIGDASIAIAAIAQARVDSHRETPLHD